MAMGSLILFSIASAVGVFVVCTLIDMVRIRFIEKPVLSWLNKYRWWNKELY